MIRPLLLLLLLFLISSAASQPLPLRATLIDCGATSPTPTLQGEWIPDSPFVSSGTPLSLPFHYADPTISTLRTFPFLPVASSVTRSLSIAGLGTWSGQPTSMEGIARRPLFLIRLWTGPFGRW
ncbi:hypothetical protein MLD38_016901 [Melastoma candidum]|uniref:Uncharacterized protein n=1 Tax=Melastoma candidum TaxID=119954 RepID=A0ACB9QQ38_9MYRT|nr:hypothetical protein MLD38_016901 [Melastoma candidum]